MSGKNIFLVLVAVLVAVGLYVLVMGPGDVPVVPVEMPSVLAPPIPPSAPQIEQGVEPAPALDDVAKDAAAEVERLKKEQQDMGEKPATPPDMSQPDMR